MFEKISSLKKFKSTPGNEYNRKSITNSKNTTNILFHSTSFLGISRGTRINYLMIKTRYINLVTQSL
jgi:hypothetical protein